MKLLHIIALRISLLTITILMFWSVLFYYEIMAEVNDEVDDSLEDYAEMIVIRFVRNEELPTASSGSNNQFFIKKITQEQANSQERIRYQDREVYLEAKKEFEPARVLTYVFENGEGEFYELEVSTPNIDKQDLREAILILILCLFGAILLSILALNLWSIRRTMRPLHNLLQWIKNYKIGEGYSPLNNPTKISEFRTLNNTVKESINNAELAYEKQKLFVGNASHEMQTPLAISNSRLEALLDDTTLTPKQMEEIIKTRQTLDRLARMNRSLLLLTKLDNKQIVTGTKICVNDNLTKLLPDYQMVYQTKNISVTLNSKENFYIHIDESLANMLIANLLKNAFIYNTTGGIINITIDSRSISIANTGLQEPLDKDLIFERFYHGTSNTSSTGLGLSVVKAICQNYGLSVDYKFINQMHNFTVHL